MMNFRVIKNALVALLGNEADGRFVVLGYQKQSQRAEELLGNSRNVQVYYDEGDFLKSKASLNGPTQHDIKFKIDCMVASRAEVDLSTINSEVSTPLEKAIALSAARTASEIAGESLDELFEIIYQIIMDARNIDLGVGFKIANRWVSQIGRDDPIPVGEFCVLTGAITLECSIDEQIDGESPILGTDGIHMDLEINGEPASQAGVSNERTFLIDDSTGDYLIDDLTGDYIIAG